MFFSYINLCRTPRKLFEQEAVRPSVKTSPEGPGKCKCNETNMCNRYSSIFYLILTKSPPKTPLNLKITFFLILVFDKQNDASVVKFSNVITSSQRHNACNVFANKNVNVIISNVFLCNVVQTNQGLF